MDMKVLAQSVRRNPDKIGQAMMALTLGFRDLPASGAEVKIIAARMGPSAAALTGEHASEANVYKLADDGGLARFRVLHFSTHGFLSDDEPGLSAIVLSQVNRAPGTDGYLTVAEIAPLELRSDLVVVSACDSGAGRLQRGEGLLGLSYALFQAGTVSSIVSLWPIPDKASADFMVRFYEEWTPGTSPAAALAQTKRWALQKGLPAHMVDAFVYFGI
jgi:CHAT domain-containing protein